MSTKKIYLVILGHQTSTQENAFKVISKGKKKKEKKEEKETDSRCHFSNSRFRSFWGSSSGMICSI